MDYVDELDYWQVKELNMEVKLFLETSSSIMMVMVEKMHHLDDHVY